MSMRPHTETTMGVTKLTKSMQRLVDRVEKGETVVITRRGTPVAKLVPIQPKFDPERVREAIENLKRIAKKRKPLPPGMTIRDMIYEGRR